MTDLKATLDTMGVGSNRTINLGNGVTLRMSRRDETTYKFWFLRSEGEITPMLGHRFYGPAADVMKWSGIMATGKLVA